MLYIQVAQLPGDPSVGAGDACRAPKHPPGPPSPLLPEIPSVPTTVLIKNDGAALGVGSVRDCEEVGALVREED